MQYIDNKYTNWYYSIIRSAQYRHIGSEIYVEKHHIIPKSLGGGNQAANIVVLTPREHFVCHLLLTKMTVGGSQHKMIHAAWMMARTRKNIQVTSRTYSLLKEKSTKILSDNSKGIPVGPHSDDHRKKLSEASIKRYQDPEQRRLASIQNSGRVMSQQARAKMSIAGKERAKRIGVPIGGMQGKTHSAETKEKMRLAWEKRRNGS